MSSRSPSVLLIDYGMGNLRNVARSLKRAGACARASADPAEVRAAERIVLPGVGAMGDCMTRLRESGLDQALRERLQAGTPYLGICLGLQVLLESGEEGGCAGLGLLKGRVARFPDSLGLAVPHMGWNFVDVRAPHPVLESGYFYFVHSYRPVDVDPASALATTEYGPHFASALGQGNLIGVQFHPEKSQQAGLRLLERFCRWTP